MTANQIAYQRAMEEARANLAIEALRRAELEELQRHNLVSEQETNRSNLARELEANRHNVATEGIGMQGNAIQATNVYNQRELGYAKLAEEQRHNIVSEVETSTHNENTESLKKQEIETTTKNITSKAAADLALARYKEQQANKRHRQELAVRLQSAAIQSGGKITSDMIRTFAQLSTAR